MTPSIGVLKLGNYIQSYSITLVKVIEFILYLNIKSRK